MTHLPDPQRDTPRRRQGPPGEGIRTRPHTATSVSNTFTNVALLGENRMYHSGERFWFGEADLRALEPYALADPCAGAGHRLLLVDRGDEVIDPAPALARYRGCARCLAFDGGDHGFAHLRQSLAAIVETYEACPPVSLAAEA